ncbi:uncharacterized protein TNIN_298221 [Trichonephila inaurata madagascariensis]|uniref:Uncharacterized protein n=1 Tax=Trichonephila inaurata madagascariensis TaxID=2747483 RepID=A0A8X6YAM5_9ARAC|nr:uncharacterized protein TNIN_298221 [Trichonephila inaurata madagascariensis]
METHITTNGPCRSCYPLDANSRHKNCNCSYTTPIFHVPKMCYSHGSPIGHHTFRNTCCHGAPTYKWPQEGFPDPPLGPPECNKECQEIRMKPLDRWLPHCKYVTAADRKDFYIVHICECFDPSKVLHCTRFV